MKKWQRIQARKGYLTWQEYMEAVKEDGLEKADGTRDKQR